MITILTKLSRQQTTHLTYITSRLLTGKSTDITLTVKVLRS